MPDFIEGVLQCVDLVGGVHEKLCITVPKYDAITMKNDIEKLKVELTYISLRELGRVSSKLVDAIQNMGLILGRCLVS